jgi:hypothetical protein
MAMSSRLLRWEPSDNAAAAPRLHRIYFDQTRRLYDGKGKVVDSWTATHFVQVKPKAKHFGQGGVAEYVIDTCYGADDLAWMKKQYGMKPIDVQRAGELSQGNVRLASWPIKIDRA